MKTITIYDPWAAAYAIATGAHLLSIQPGEFPQFLFADEDGAASRTLSAWRTGNAMVHAKNFASAYRHLRRLLRSQPHPASVVEEYSTDEHRPADHLA